MRRSFCLSCEVVTCAKCLVQQHVDRGCLTMSLEALLSALRTELVEELKLLETALETTLKRGLHANAVAAEVEASIMESERVVDTAAAEVVAAVEAWHRTTKARTTARLAAGRFGNGARGT
mmetsp:Transcript_47629/g.112090  ORF Transcript_47629/g.112090 Transcript_47629/m.112090 type:complete len:121 (+) Transcript_47629:208-570(+)